MKKFVSASILIFLFMSATGQIMRTDTTDNHLVNKYGNELRRLAIKYKIERAFGFSRTVTFRDKECIETTVIFYRDKDGEVQDQIVNARTISYGETATNEDTVISIKNHEHTDSLTFVAKKVSKSRDGFLVVGNVQDGSLEIPVVLSTAPKEKIISNNQRFRLEGNPVFANGRAVACMFQPVGVEPFILLKILRSDRVNNFYGSQKDQCYIEEHIIPTEWWNGGRGNMSWQSQLDYIRQNY
jgi:hypothetical protein